MKGDILDGNAPLVAQSEPEQRATYRPEVKGTGSLKSAIELINADRVILRCDAPQQIIWNGFEIWCQRGDNLVPQPFWWLMAQNKQDVETGLAEVRRHIGVIRERAQRQSKGILPLGGVESGKIFSSLPHLTPERVRNPQTPVEILNSRYRLPEPTARLLKGADSVDLERMERLLDETNTADPDTLNEQDYVDQS